MIKMIIDLAFKLYGKAYSDLLAIDLLDYSDKEIKEAYNILLADSKLQRIDNVSKQWLLSNTTC